MRLYLDSSAIVKLIRDEPETPALRAYLRRNGVDARVTSALARTEVVRAVLPAGALAVANARQVLRSLSQLDVDEPVLESAAILPATPMLRSLDAIHVASALTFGADLRSIVTYDTRMAAAAEALGLPTAAPV